MRNMPTAELAEHRPGGLFVAVGPGIAPGHLANPVSILDFAPTFCDALGIPHNRFEGKPISEIAEPVKPHLAYE